MTAAGQGVAPELSARVCLDLGHAYAEHAAKRAGVRLLHIKGLAADRVLPIDDARVSDVDVLLDPEGLTRFSSSGRIASWLTMPRGARRRMRSRLRSLVWE